MDNFYEILGVENTASEDDIRSAIRKNRKRYRQVTGSPNKEQARNAEVMMDKLAEAEVQLLDPDKREAYDRALASEPTTPEADESPPSRGRTDWVDTAKDYLANGSPRNASRAATQATMDQPESVEAWKIRAYAALELRDYADADFSASEAHRREQSNPGILGLLGDVYDAEGRYQKVEQTFSKAAQLEPGNPYWRGRAVIAMSEQGRVGDAVFAANDLISKFPQNEFAKNVLAIVLLDDAEAALSRQGNSIYYTNKNQIEYVERRLNEVDSLSLQDEGLLWSRQATGNLLEQAKKRKFHRITYRRIFANLVLVVLTLSLLAAGAVGAGLFFLILTGLFVWWTIERCWPYQWKINKKALGPAAKTGVQ